MEINNDNVNHIDSRLFENDIDRVQILPAGFESEDLIDDSDEEMEHKFGL